MRLVNAVGVVVSRRRLFDSASVYLFISICLETGHFRPILKFQELLIKIHILIQCNIILHLGVAQEQLHLLKQLHTLLVDLVRFILAVHQEVDELLR